MYPVGMRILLPLLVACWIAAPPSHGQEHGHSAGEVFAARCANCHTVPDVSLRTDRVWLDQINRTT